MRRLAGLGDYAWTNRSVTTGSPVAADDVRDLRTALGQALTALGLPVPVYNPDPTIYNGQSGVWTVVKRDHIKQLRDGATRGQGAAAGGSGTPVPADGLGGLTYDSASNRVTTAGWEYDSAGSQTRGRDTSGGWQRYEYDAAGRLAKVLTDDRSVVLATYTYGESNERLIAEEGGELAEAVGRAEGDRQALVARVEGELKVVTWNIKERAAAVFEPLFRRAQDEARARHRRHYKWLCVFALGAIIMCALMWLSSPTGQAAVDAARWRAWQRGFRPEQAERLNQVLTEIEAEGRELRTGRR